MTRLDPSPRPTLHVLGIGVSKYEDGRFDLTWAGKDARDIVNVFAGQKARFASVRTKLLVDADAIHRLAAEVEAFLAPVGVDDEIVVFLAGHGVLAGPGDYYFAPFDMDFSRPTARGIRLETLEDVLARAPARKKLLFVDSCHSGQLADGASAVSDTSASVGEHVTMRRTRGLGSGVRKIELDEGALVMQELFADLRRSSGTAIVSATSGAEFAYEDARYQNGVFTFAVLRGLQEMHADRNRDGQVTLSELRDYVATTVLELTHSRQRPAMRREAGRFDRVVYRLDGQ